jgi:hypothetical protein
VRDLSRALLLVVSAVLLLSYGGAIVAAPLTVPRSSKRCPFYRHT